MALPAMRRVKSRMSKLMQILSSVRGGIRAAVHRLPALRVRAYLRARHAEVDLATMQVNGRPVIMLGEGSRLRIGRGFFINSGPIDSIDNGRCSKIVVYDGATLEIGDYSGISNTVILCLQSIRIGSHVNIGAGTMIFDSNFHSSDWRERVNRATDTHYKTSPVSIGDVVFIGARSIICKGVHIGDHAMVAAGSVVVKDIPADELWGGNPARFIMRLD